jgi:hypothetical protein
MTVPLSTLNPGRALPPRKISGNHFCQRMCETQGYNGAEIRRKIEKVISSENRTHDLSACSIVLRYRYNTSTIQTNNESIFYRVSIPSVLVYVMFAS